MVKFKDNSKRTIKSTSDTFFPAKPSYLPEDFEWYIMK